MFIIRYYLDIFISVNSRLEKIYAKLTIVWPLLNGKNYVLKNPHITYTFYRGNTMLTINFHWPNKSKSKVKCNKNKKISKKTV
jgi:hypothetical protein